MGLCAKGQTILTGEGWIQRRIVRDMDNAGHKEVKLKFEGDQAPSILVLQQEVQRLRSSKSIPINSPFGESEGNGRAENAIKRVHSTSHEVKRIFLR